MIVQAVRKKGRDIMKRMLAMIVATIMIVLCLPLIASAEEPITIVIQDFSSTVASTEKAYKMVQDYILEQTGVKVEIIHRTGSNDTEKLNAMLSGDEQIDGFFASWRTYQNYGMIKPINEYLEKYGQNILKQWDRYGGMTTMKDADGTYWGLQRLFTARSFYKAFIREDYLAQLNMEVPKTIDELNTYLYAVKELDPYGNGETIPMITRGGSLDVLCYQFLGGYTPYGFSWWLDGDELKPYFMQEGYNDFLKQVAAWYADGILHKEQFSWNTATTRSYIDSGRGACVAAYGTDCTMYGYSLRQRGIVYTDYKPGLTGPNGELTQTAIKGTDVGVLFSAKSDEEHTIAFMKVMDWMYADWENFCIGMYGIKGVHWDYDYSFEDAETKHITKLLDASGEYSGQEFWLASGLYEFDAMQYDADGVQNVHNSYLPQQLYIDQVKLPVDLYVYWDTSAVAENVDGYSDITRMLKEEQLKFVMGARDLSEWDAFIQELYDAGLQDYINEYTRQWNEAQN